jgi:hypothetical protein
MTTADGESVLHPGMLCCAATACSTDHHTTHLTACRPTRHAIPPKRKLCTHRQHPSCLSGTFSALSIPCPPVSSLTPLSLLAPQPPLPFPPDAADLDVFVVKGTYNPTTKATAAPPAEFAPLPAAKSGAAAASECEEEDGLALATMDIFAGCGGLSEGMHQVHLHAQRIAAALAWHGGHLDPCCGHTHKNTHGSLSIKSNPPCSRLCTPRPAQLPPSGPSSMSSPPQTPSSSTTPRHLSSATIAMSSWW